MGRRSPGAGMRRDRGRKTARIAAATAVRSQSAPTTLVMPMTFTAIAEPVCIDSAMTTTSSGAGT